MRHLLLALVLLPGCASTSSAPSGSTSSPSTTSSVTASGTISSAASSTAGTSPGASTTTSSSSSPSALDAGGGDGSAGCGSLALCDDFESDTVGGPPNPALWTLFGLAGCSGQGNDAAPPVFSITVDDTQHHSGSKSAKVDTSKAAGSGCGPFMINTSAFAQLTGGEVYGRFYVHLSDTTMMFDHTVLMGLGLLKDAGVGLDIQNADSYLELASEGAGNATNVFMWQRSDGFGTLPAKNSAGGAQSAYPSASGFTCVEFHTSTSGAIQTWVNETLVAGLTDPPAPANQTAWTPPTPLTPTSLALGWQVFSGPYLTVWFDDVALSTTRIHCQ